MYSKIINIFLKDEELEIGTTVIGCPLLQSQWIAPGCLSIHIEKKKKKKVAKGLILKNSLQK